MKKKLLTGVAIFMSSLLIMQALFSEGYKSQAAHSKTASYLYKNKIVFLVESETNKMSMAYGLDEWARIGTTGTSDVRTLDPQLSLLLNTAVLVAYHKDNVTPSTVFTQDDINSYYATKRVIYNIIENKFDGSISSASSPWAKAIAYHVANPSYINDQENVLNWNESTNKFELTLTNTVTDGTYSANNLIKADMTTLPNGVEVVANGETLKITSTNEFTSATTIKLYKRIQEKGKLVVWDMGEAEDYVTLDYDEPSIAKVMELKIKTGSKPVVATPTPTVAPTITPTVEATSDVTEIAAPIVEATESAIESTSPVIETTTSTIETSEKYNEPIEENVGAEIITNDATEVSEEQLNEALDDVPSTGDKINTELLFSLIGASAITLVACLFMNTYKKRKDI